MILPTRHLMPARCLLGVGAGILETLRRPLTVSALWDRTREVWANRRGAPITYGWFVLSLDLLFLVGAVEFRGGVLRRTKP